MEGILSGVSAARISNNLFNAIEKFFKESGDVRGIDRIIRVIYPGFAEDDEARRLVFMNEICELMGVGVWYELMVDEEGIKELIKRACLHFVDCWCDEKNSVHTIYYPEIEKLCPYILSLFDDNVCGNINGMVYVSLRHREVLKNKKYLDENAEKANIKHLLAFAGKHPGIQRYFKLFSVRHKRIIAKLIGAFDRGLKILPITQWPSSWDYKNKVMIVTKDCPKGSVVVVK